MGCRSDSHKSSLHWTPRATLCLARHPSSSPPCLRLGLLKENSLSWARKDGTFKGPPVSSKSTAGSMKEDMGGMLAIQSLVPWVPVAPADRTPFTCYGTDGHPLVPGLL